MFGKNDVPNSINFLDSVEDPENIFAHAYDWMFSIGKYMLIAVEILALGAFIARFILDAQNNDLTKDINSQVEMLSGSNWQQDSITYENIQALLIDIDKLSNEQEINSVLINEIRNGIPSALNVLTFSFNKGSISLSLETTNFKAFKDYEAALKNNDNYEGVTFQVTKNDTVYEITVNFKIKEASG
ncbi:MAG: transmembrane(s)protein [candidate division WS6 bacterium 34_10]|uniref:Transmembrane(S)protein n=1 Tax=candidate division WS6 bacterium 34_10 TaxID=1641389 RepID=A0A101HIT3_9BACT|nr:MAG: transmembrane(s)protein [candidate division WS6 bacterium 34_10]